MNITFQSEGSFSLVVFCSFFSKQRRITFNDYYFHHELLMLCTVFTHDIAYLTADTFYKNFIETSIRNIYNNKTSHPNGKTSYIHVSWFDTSKGMTNTLLNLPIFLTYKDTDHKVPYQYTPHSPCPSMSGLNIPIANPFVWYFPSKHAHYVLLPHTPHELGIIHHNRDGNK